MPCFPDRPLCLVNFKHFSSFLQRCSGLGRAAKPPDLRSFVRVILQYKLTAGINFLGKVFHLDSEEAGSSTCQWACPSDSQCAAAPVPRHKGLAAQVLPALKKLAFTAEAVFASFFRLRIHTFTQPGEKWIHRIRLRKLPIATAGADLIFFVKSPSF